MPPTCAARPAVSIKLLRDSPPQQSWLTCSFLTFSGWSVEPVPTGVDEVFQASFDPGVQIVSSLVEVFRVLLRLRSL